LLNSVDGSSDIFGTAVDIHIGESSRREGLEKIVDLYNRDGNDEMTNDIMSEQEDDVDVNNDDSIGNSERREPSQHYKQSKYHEQAMPVNH